MNDYGFKLGDYVWLENIRKVALLDNEFGVFLANITPQEAIRYATKEEILNQY